MSVVQIDWKPDAPKLRNFGWICLVAFGAIGAWVHYRHSIFAIHLSADRTVSVAFGLWIVAGACLLLGLAAPMALKPLYLGLMIVSAPIGYVLSHIIMAVVFFIVLTPVGLIMRLVGYDPMQRRFEPSAKSYWAPRSQAADVKRYFRQF